MDCFVFRHYYFLLVKPHQSQAILRSLRIRLTKERPTMTSTTLQEQPQQEPATQQPNAFLQQLQQPAEEMSPSSPESTKKNPAVVYWKVSSPVSVRNFDPPRGDNGEGIPGSPKVYKAAERFESKLPCLDENNELDDTNADLDSCFSSEGTSESTGNGKKNRKKKLGASSSVTGKKTDRIKQVKELQKDATDLAHRGQEDEAQDLYRQAIQIAGSEISRINFRIVKSQREHEATRASIQQHLSEDLRKIGLIIGKLRTKMAILYERSGKFDRAIACCREAMEIYKHQPVVDEAAKKNTLEMMDLMKLMMERLEQSQKELEGRGALLLMIKEYRRSITLTVDSQEKKDLYVAVERTAKKVEIMEVKALGDSHPQLAETLQMLSTIVLEQGKYQESVDYLEKAIKICKASLGMKHARIGQYYLRLARIHLGQGIESLALEKFESAKEILKHSSKFYRILGSTLNDVGVIYMRRREYENAVTNLLTALTFYERSLKQQAGKRDPLAPKDCPLSTDSLQVLRNLGECYMKMEDFDLACQEFTKVLTLQKDARKVHDNVIDLDLGITGVETLLLTLINDESIADTLVRLGRAEAAGGNHRSALEVFKEAVEYLNRVAVSDVLAHGPSGRSDKKHRFRSDQMTNTLYCIAEECRVLEEYDEALRYYNESMRLRSCSSAQSQNHTEASTVHCALCFIGIANVHWGKGQFVRAKKLLNETQDFCIGNGVPAKHAVMAMIKHTHKEVMRGMARDVAERKQDLEVLEERAMQNIKAEAYEQASVNLAAAMEIRKNALATLRSAGEDTAEQFHGIACLLRSFGSVYARMGDEENADRAYSDATRLFKRSGASDSLEV